MIFQYFSFSPLFQERKPSKNINDINFERENIWNKIEKSKFFGSMFEIKNAIFCVALFSSQVPTNKLAHCPFLGHCAISLLFFLCDEHHFFRAWMPLTQRRLPLAELCIVYPHHGAPSTKLSCLISSKPIRSIRMPTPPWVLCLGLSKLQRTGKGPIAHKTQPCNHWSCGSEGGKVVLKKPKKGIRLNALLSLG